MAKYIDADRLKKHFAWWGTTGIDTYEKNKKDFEQIIDLQPAADVAEVRHGRWIDLNDSIVAGICSVCGWKSIWQESYVVEMNYCPNCGAHMVNENE